MPREEWRRDHDGEKLGLVDVIRAVSGGADVQAVMSRAQQDTDYSKVQIKVTKVSGNIYMLEGEGGNIAASVGEDGIVIVDDQFAPLAEKIQAALKNLGSHGQAGALRDQHALSWRSYRRKRAILNRGIHRDCAGQRPQAAGDRRSGREMAGQ